jgi:lipopolysaccharide/colanic/teichoic acid biosynthesis glycosyltransferase
MRSTQAAIVVPTPPPELEITKWCNSGGKRIFDLVCGVPVLVVALPVMLIIALAIKLTSRGPVLFRQRRVGRDGREFEILKFRTMYHGANGLGITARGDSRITALGRVLRKSKLDELPQLFNVISGEMGLVGPRPDLAEFISELPLSLRQVLVLRPGLTGWATLHFRHEEELLAQIPPRSLRDYYAKTLLPKKVRLDLEYAGKASFLVDATILLRTVLAIITHGAD